MIGPAGVLKERSKTAPARNLNQTIEAAARNLLSSRKEDGHWRFELEGDTILESEYVLLLYFLGRAGDPRVTACCRRLRSQQMPTGRLGDLSGRTGRSKRVRQGLSVPEARRRRPAFAAHGRGTPRDPRRRRAACLQLVHEVVPGNLRPVALATGAGGAPGDDPPAAVVLLQHLRHVFVDAGDGRSAVGDLGPPAERAARRHAR